MRNAIVKVWSGEAGFLKWFFYVPLFLLSRIYKICLRVREILYNRGRFTVEGVAVPIISVGNITLGGTGKTPVVERLSTMLKEAGFNPAIATRGYRRKRKGTFAVDPEKDKAEDVGDEALMLARKTGVPVLVGVNRAEAIGMGMKKFPIDVVILDDGFQLRNIEKDMEVLVVKGNRSGTSRELFPLGPCREPFARVRDADIILVNKGQPDKEMEGYMDEARCYTMRYKPMYLYNLKHKGMVHYRRLRGKKVLAFSGLGDNGSFFGLLKELGADVVHELPFGDHHDYTERDIRRISACCDVDMIVTTEKDGVKIAAMNVPDNLFYLAVIAEIHKEQELLELIQEKLKREICQRESLYSTRH